VDVEASRIHVQLDARPLPPIFVDDIDPRSALVDVGLVQIEIVGVRAAGIGKVDLIEGQAGYVDMIGAAQPDETGLDEDRSSDRPGGADDDRGGSGVDGAWIVPAGR
jgi:hypothetical protein